MSDLAWRNRRLLAERCAWPAGVLEECERLDGEHPDWSVSWLPPNAIPGWERPAGYVAGREDVSLPCADELRRLPEDYVARYPRVFAPGVEGLLVRMAAVEERIAADRERADRLWRSMRAGRVHHPAH